MWSALRASVWRQIHTLTFRLLEILSQIFNRVFFFFCGQIRHLHLCHHFFRVNSFHLFFSFWLAQPRRQQLWPPQPILDKPSASFSFNVNTTMKDGRQLSVLVQLLQYQPQMGRDMCSTPVDTSPVICTPTYFSNNRWKRNAKQRDIIWGWGLDNLKQVTHKRHQNKNEVFRFIPAWWSSWFVNKKRASALMGGSTVNHIFAMPI